LNKVKGKRRLGEKGKRVGKVKGERVKVKVVGG
jgi:hypothetical protein